MNKRQFLKGMAATAAGILVPGHVLSEQYEFHQRVPGLKSVSSAPSGPIMQDATPQQRTGIISTGVPLAEDGGVSWYGEVPSADLITGVDLAHIINFTNGMTINRSVGWLHIGIDGKELFIAKRPLRVSMSWRYINDSMNAVSGNRIIPINGVNYKLRLINATDGSSRAEGYDIAHSHYSEWNRIFYRLTQNVYSDYRNTKSSEEPFTHLANYSEAELAIDYRNGIGSMTWCQGSGVVRGYRGVSHFSTYTIVAANNNHGWRPVLEKV